MAITKLMNIGTAKKGGSAHLYNAIRYIMNPEKTNGGMLLGGNSGNAPAEVYGVMLQTKKDWEKPGGRQGYHFVLSWRPGEADRQEAYEVIREFCEEYLGDNYDYVFAVHDDKEHMHGHVIFNSVNRVDGYKYRYERGDWEKHIQPVTDRICERHGLKKLEYDRGERTGKSYAEYFAEKEGRPTWKKIIRADIDYAVSISDSFEDFHRQMKRFGYKIRIGKYVTYTAPGQKKGWRDKSLGAGYGKGEIIERILHRDAEKGAGEILSPRMKKAYAAGFQKFAMQPISRYQVRRFRAFYLAGHYLEEKNPFAVNKKEVRQNAIHIQKLYEECTYLLQNGIRSEEELKTHLKQLREKEAMLKNQRGTYQAPREDSLVKEYQRLLKELERIPAWDDSFEALQERLEELGGRLPDGALEEGLGREQENQAELSKVRTRIRIAERIQRGDEKIQGKEPGIGRKARKEPVPRA